MDLDFYKKAGIAKTKRTQEVSGSTEKEATKEFGLFGARNA